MNSEVTNRIYLTEDWALFLGVFDHNLDHKHYASQLCIPLYDNSIEIESSIGKTLSAEAIFIPSNHQHKVHSTQVFALLLFNPFLKISEINEIMEMQNEYIKRMKLLCEKSLNQEITQDQFKVSLIKFIKVLYDSTRVNIDIRIFNAIQYIKQKDHRVVPLSEIAQYCHLSESRFLHLFKSEMNIAFRKAQQWHRLSRSIPKLIRYNISHTAYYYGFTDGAHYSKVFKENFGFSPKAILKNSQLIQVLKNYGQ